MSPAATSPRKIIVIGGGIAGLCTAVYARRCGYDVQLLEQHETAGGLATSWRRGGYTFETCLHWLLGCNPARQMYSHWADVLDIDKLRFVYPEEYVRLEDAHGGRLIVYSNVDRLEGELLRQAPEDRHAILHLTSSIRKLADVPLPDPAAPWPQYWSTMLHALSHLPTLWECSSISCADYGRRFRHPLLRAFFGTGELAELSALALLLSMSWMNERDAAYPVGGSRALIGGIVERLELLGADLRLGTRVTKILVEADCAVGVRLENGADLEADWIVSAADGHATLDELLDGEYTDEGTARDYRTLVEFPSYLQVSLGIARDLSQHGALLSRVLDAPLAVDPQTALGQLAFRFFHFDPTFAPAGRTAVTCFLPTRNAAYWSRLRNEDRAAYETEKHRVADAVIGILDQCIRGLRELIEVVDVSTPATVMRYTGNWRGSMEGWLLTPATGFRPLPNTLPRLHRFLMAGHWVMPGGGLPSGLMTARSAVHAICAHDGTPFLRGHRSLELPHRH